VRESLGLSLRKACLLVNLSTYVYCYRPKPDNNDVLRHRLRELAEQRKRFGSPRLHLLLKSEGLVVNQADREDIQRGRIISKEEKTKKDSCGGQSGTTSCDKAKRKMVD
jgi:putative transposase